MKVRDDCGGPMSKEGRGIVMGKKMEALHVKVALDESGGDKATSGIDDFTGMRR